MGSFITGGIVSSKAPCGGAVECILGRDEGLNGCPRAIVGVGVFVLLCVVENVLKENIEIAAALRKL